MLIRRAAVAGAALSLTLLLGACSGSGGGNDQGSHRAEDAAAPNAAAPTAAPGTRAPSTAPADTPGTGGTGNPATGQAPAAGNRQLILTAEVRLEADNPEAVAASARSLVIGMGGMVGGEETKRVPLPPPTSANEDTNYSPAPPRYSVTSTLTLKVPPAQFDKAIDELSALGTVVARNRTATDVTEQVVDVASRVETQRKSVDRVRQLLAQAATIQEIISLESELTEREAELDSLLKRQQSLAGQVDLATIAVTVNSPTPSDSTKPAQDKDDDESFGGEIVDALQGGGKAFVVTLGVVLQITAAVLPFAAAALVLWLLVRRFATPLRRALARRRTHRRETNETGDTTHQAYGSPRAYGARTAYTAPATNEAPASPHARGHHQNPPTAPTTTLPQPTAPTPPPPPADDTGPANPPPPQAPPA